MTEFTDFYNNGIDWICRRCESELAADSDTDEQMTPEHQPLAKWMDKTRRVLICPRCGLTESVEKS
ncbi:MAG TPA: hypothetical protein PLL77_02705 [Pyrinomonadaceae bacterium]|nr:hypothetical protein [Pyrinomonadaceae bacterium]